MRRSPLTAFPLALFALSLFLGPLSAQDELLGEVLSEEEDAARGWARDSFIELGMSQGWMDIDDAEGAQDWGTAGKGPSLDLDAGTALSFLPGSLPSLEHGPLLDFSASLDTRVEDEVAGNPFIVGDDFSARADSGWKLSLSSAGASSFFFSAALLGGLGVKGFSESDPLYLPTGAVPSDFWFRVQTRFVMDASLGIRSKRFDATLKERYVALKDVGAAYGLGAVAGFEQSLGADMDLVLVDGKGWKWILGMEAGLELESRIVVPKQVMDFDARMDLDFKDIGRMRLVFLGWQRDSDLPGLDRAAETDVKVQWFGKLSWKAELPDGDYTLSFRWPYAASQDGANEDGRWEIGLSWAQER